MIISDVLAFFVNKVSLEKESHCYVERCCMRPQMIVSLLETSARSGTLAPEQVLVSLSLRMRCTHQWKFGTQHSARS